MALEVVTVTADAHDARFCATLDLAPAAVRAHDASFEQHLARELPQLMLMMLTLAGWMLDFRGS